MASSNSIPVLATVGLMGACAATNTATSVTHARQARAAAAQDFSCGQKDLKIDDAEMDVFLIEGCGQIATYYCTEDNATLSTKCSQVTDVAAIEAQGNLADALAAQDKADQEAAERPAPKVSAAKQTP